MSVVPFHLEPMPGPDSLFLAYFVFEPTVLSHLTGQGKGANDSG